MDDLPPELVVKILHLRADARHDEACRDGAKCVEPALCPEARSPEPALVQISDRWEAIARSNPKLFSKIRVKVNLEFNSVQDMHTVPIDNEEEVRALVELSGSEDIHLSIGCSTDPRQFQPQLEEATTFSVGQSLASRITSLVIDFDNFPLLFGVGNTAFPRLKSIQLERGLKPDPFDIYPSAHIPTSITESLRFWRIPLKRIICGHPKNAAIRGLLSWDPITVLDLSGIELGYKEIDVEAMVHLGPCIEELRVYVDSTSMQYGIPDQSFFSTGRKFGPIVHNHLEKLLIAHAIPEPLPSGQPSKPIYSLFKNAKFGALKEVWYMPNGVPHPDSIAWLTKDTPTVKRLSISSKFSPPKTLQSVMAAMQGLQALYLLGPGPEPREVRMGIVNVMENATLRVLERVSSPGLQTLAVLGEANFSISSLSRFVDSRSTTLQSIIIHDWCGPSPAQLEVLKALLNPVALQVGSVYSCAATRKNGLRNERSSASTRVMRGVALDTMPRGIGRDGVFWCVPCCAAHYAEKVDDTSDANPPGLNARQRRFAPM